MDDLSPDQFLDPAAKAFLDKLGLGDKYPARSVLLCNIGLYYMDAVHGINSKLEKFPSPQDPNERLICLLHGVGISRWGSTRGTRDTLHILFARLIDKTHGWKLESLEYEEPIFVARLQPATLFEVLM